ncbi:hypothetical protein H6P81_020591 [Aristolochia fimbriata]|uniref:Uncharacterized protein n=1 Tax=Aristolochia fimbriata TaxID=158543 RepID=A0AAV7DY38_ARIFI|nr:hypothetical protein H6P81_020591 [Aristolochia fimbriata]
MLDFPNLLPYTSVMRGQKVEKGGGRSPNWTQKSEEREASNYHHDVKIDMDPCVLESMTERMRRGPKLLKKTAGGSSCCIFRIPHSLAEINPKAYRPQIVSIGPYHHGKTKELQMIEEHKWRFLNEFLDRTQSSTGTGLDEYMKEMMKLVPQARDCYSEEIPLSDTEFAKVLLLDGCFVVGLLRKYGEVEEFEDEDPIFLVPWVIPFLMRDLLKLENQIPFFVLKRLFEVSENPDGKKGGIASYSLVRLALEFFNAGMTRPAEVLDGFSDNFDSKHLLDLFRSSFLTGKTREPEQDNPSAKLINSVSKLRAAGIGFQVLPEAESFLEIKFRNGVLGIPKLTIDDFSGAFLQNCVAFEQSHQHCSMYMTTYATFMDCLIDTGKDVSLLRDDKIIDNYFGTDEEVASLFNDMGKDVAFDVESCYLAEQLERVNGYYWNNWHVYWATFRNSYFSSPWSIISVMAASLLLCLTFVQTFFEVYDCCESNHP